MNLFDLDTRARWCDVVPLVHTDQRVVYNETGDSLINLVVLECGSTLVMLHVLFKIC